MMADGLHVYDDPVDTLANQPTFPWHMENLRTYITATSDFPQTVTWRGAELKPMALVPACAEFRVTAIRRAVL